MDAKEIIERILDDVNLNQSSFLEKIGVSTSTFSEIKSGKTKNISRRVATKIVDIYPQFSIKWIMTGEGNMYAEGNSAPVFHNSGDNVTNQQTAANDISAKLIDIIQRKDEQIQKKDEQIDRLIGVIERFSSGSSS